MGVKVGVGVKVGQFAIVDKVTSASPLLTSVPQALTEKYVQLARSADVMERVCVSPPRAYNTYSFVPMSPSVLLHQIMAFSFF